METYSFLKHNPLSVYLYNKILDLRCRNVKAFIFVATTGRSGTDSLTRIFKSIPGIAAFHEPYPPMTNDHVFYGIKDKDAYLNELFKKKKRIYIKRNAIGHTHYIETNHLFVKNFINQAVCEFGNKIKIIHLRRDPIKVAMSFYGINSIPGITRRGRLYLLDPLEEENLIKFPRIATRTEEENFLRCLWYWYEIEARIAAYKAKYSYLPWFFFETEGLNDFEQLKKLFDQLEIDVGNDHLHRNIGVRTNIKRNEKKNTVDLAKCYEIRDRFVDYLKRQHEKELGFLMERNRND